MKKILLFLWLAIAAQAAPPATYVPRSIKELDDSRGVTLVTRFTPIFDGTKFTPRALLALDISDMSAEGRQLVQAATDTLARAAMGVAINIDVAGVQNPITIRDTVVLVEDLILDMKTGTIQVLKLTADTELSFSHPGGVANQGRSVFMRVTNEAGVDRTLTFPESYSLTNGTLVTSFVIPAGLTLELCWIYDLADDVWYLTGDPLTAGAGGGAWGDITGTLSDQTDLQSALNAKQGLDSDLTYLAGFTPTANVKSILNAADFAAVNTLLSLTIGTNVQAYDADLTTWAGITPGTGVGTALAINVGSSGAVVVNGDALGTPSSGTLTDVTGLPISTGVSGLGTGVATLLATPTFANLNTAISDADLARTDAANTFTGVQTMTSPALTTPAITGLATGSGVASAATASTLAARDANGDLTVRDVILASGRFINWGGGITISASSSGISLNGGLILTIQSLTGAGAVNLTTGTTKLTSTGIGQALTLANGTNGQIKTIVYAAEGGGTDTMILTPTTMTGYSTITFTAIGNAVTLQFFTTQGWMIVSVYGATVV